MTDTPSSPQPQWNPHAAVAAWIVPGLGHIVLGQRKRGVNLLIAIGSLWVGGILIGGISVIDKYDRTEPGMGDEIVRSQPRSWWFYGQAMIAPTFFVEIARDRMAQSYVRRREEMGNSVAGGDPRQEILPADDPGDVPPPYEPSLARVAEQGVLYTALAGLLNLLAIIDVLYCDPEHRRQTSEGRIGDAGGNKAIASEANPPAEAQA